MITRREFVGQAAASIAALQCANQLVAAEAKPPAFRISLAEWSLHRTLKAGKLDNLDFAKTSKQEFGIDAVEYVNQFFMDKAEDKKYLMELKARGEDLGVKTLLIMIDNEGRLGDPDEKKRKKAVENHFKWVHAAKFLGCHSIRVNAGSGGTYEEQVGRAANGLHRLSEFAAEHGLNVLVENHGGLSSNGKWLAQVIREVDLKNCGTLPDFGNFGLGDGTSYDRYKGVEELMPYAKAVSAKSNEFDDQGQETQTDFLRMMKIVRAAGYSGYVGIEYSGKKLSEFAGIRATKALLEKVRDQLA